MVSCVEARKSNKSSEICHQSIISVQWQWAISEVGDEFCRHSNRCWAWSITSYGSHIYHSANKCTINHVLYPLRQLPQNIQLMTACHIGYRNKHFLLSFSSLLVCKGITVIYIIKVKSSLSLHFNDHFTSEPGIDGTRMSAFWILLPLRMIEVTVTTGAIRRAKLQSNHHQQPTPSF